DDIGERSAELLVSVTDPKGAPAGGVLVRVFTVLDKRVYLAGQATTGDDGRVHLTALPTGETWVIAERDGLARTSTRLVLEPGKREISLKLRDAESFEVVVVDPTQRPIRSASVTLYGTDPLPFRAFTDGRGLARLTGLGPPPYAVEVEAAGFDHKLIANLGLEDSPLFVKLERLGGLVVIVEEPDGKPAPGATVLVAGSSLWPARSAVTDENGRVTISGLSRGFFDVRAERGNLVSDAELGIMLERGENKEVRLHRVEGAYVTVKVTEGDGENAPPISGADVALVEGGISSFPRYGRTGQDGTVALGPIAGVGGATVSARADGFVPKSAIAVEEGQDQVRIGLLRGGTIVGRVVDDRDFPVDGAQLEVVGIDTEGMPIMESSSLTDFRRDHFAFALPGAPPLIPAGELGVMPVIPDIPRDVGPLFVTPSRPEEPVEGAWLSNRRGQFELTPVTPGRVRVVARHPSYVESMSDPVNLEPGEKIELKIVMHRGGILEGRVLEADRSPVVGARIELLATAASSVRITFTAEDGTFAFAALPSEVILNVSRADAPEHIVERLVLDVPPDQRREVEIILTQPRDAVKFRVIDDRGYPLDHCQISVSSLVFEEALSKTLFTDDSGEAELFGARGLPLRIVVTRAGKAPSVFEIENAPAQLDLPLDEPLSAEGTVEARFGMVANASVILFTPTGTLRTRTNEDGEFHFEGLAPTPARLLVLADGHVPHERDVNIAGDSRRPVKLGRIDLAEGGTVSGEVVDDRGDPVPGARVAAGRVPTYLPMGPLPVGIVQTDRDGHFELRDLPAGTIEIEAYKLGFGRDAVEGIEVRARDEKRNVRIVLNKDPSVDPSAVDSPGSLAVTLLEDRGAILFEHVPLGGEAERAGIFPGDRLVACNGRRIRTIENARDCFNGSLSEDMLVQLARDPGLRWRVRVRRERLRQ
ncbi:MAG TPA: carboxypeptidase regulatory-like domain-containing protein, partial [Polyangiaceae bacterium]|nr:carboxypeptidase regulatory-like domain-containing protein [Polyangiaceae bacterium]